MSLEDESPEDLVLKLRTPASISDNILRKTNSINSNVSSDRPNVYRWG